MPTPGWWLALRKAVAAAQGIDNDEPSLVTLRSKPHNGTLGFLIAFCVCWHRSF
jgi:hypothetical protein